MSASISHLIIAFILADPSDFLGRAFRKCANTYSPLTLLNLLVLSIHLLFGYKKIALIFYKHLWYTLTYILNLLLIILAYQLVIQSEKPMLFDSGYIMYKLNIFNVFVAQHYLIKLSYHFCWSNISFTKFLACFHGFRERWLVVYHANLLRYYVPFILLSFHPFQSAPTTKLWFQNDALFRSREIKSFNASETSVIGNAFHASGLSKLSFV